MNANRWSAPARARAFRKHFVGRAETVTRRYCPLGMTALRAKGFVVSIAMDGRWRHALTDSGRAARDAALGAR